MSKRNREAKSYISELENLDWNGKFIRMPRRTKTSYTPSSDGVSIIRGTPYNIDITEAEKWRIFLFNKSKNNILRTQFNNAHQVVCRNQVSCTFLGFIAGAHLKNKDYAMTI